MAETTQQYVQRILGNLDGKDPLKIQKSTAKKLHKIIKPLSKKELRRRPAAGKWSIAEVLAHLADAELVAGWRLRLILSQDGVPIQAFDRMPGRRRLLTRIEMPTTRCARSKFYAKPTSRC